MTRLDAMTIGGALALFSIPTAEANDVNEMKRDREEIIDHIRSIFDAYIRQDRETIRNTHTPDWTGFQGPSTKIERGLDDYMKNVERSLKNLRGTGYELLDTEVQIYGDLAVVYYVARYDFRDAEGNTGSLPLRSVDIYRKDDGEWIQCGSHITPVPSGGRWGESSQPVAAMAKPRTLTPAQRDELLAAREAVWRAWFAGDEAALSVLLPEETITIDPDETAWADRAEALARSRTFAAEGGKLIRLEFPRTEMQVYGPVAVLYTEYRLEYEKDGTRTTRAGRGSEIFVHRDGQWLNPGWHLEYAAGP